MPVPMGVGTVLKLGLVVDMRTRVWMGVGQPGAVPMELAIDRLVENCVGAHVLTVRRSGGRAKHVGLGQIGAGSSGHNPRAWTVNQRQRRRTPLGPGHRRGLAEGVRSAGSCATS